jgi:hypothetical protein
MLLQEELKHIIYMVGSTPKKYMSRILPYGAICRMDEQSIQNLERTANLDDKKCVMLLTCK